MCKEHLTIVMDRENDGFRAALLRGDDVIAFYFQPAPEEARAGDLYLGKVSGSRIAEVGWFLDLGDGKNGFLPRQKTLASSLEDGDCRVVQVEKEAREGKTAELTEHVQIIGRGVIYLPLSGYTAVSHRMNGDSREKWRKRVSEWCRPPEGAIVRTAAAQMPVSLISHEFHALKKRWLHLSAQAAGMGRPGLIDRQLTFVAEILNENHFPSFYTLITNLPFETNKLPAGVRLVHVSARNLFEEYRLNGTYSEAMKRRIVLPSGISLVFDYAEALTVIDVNSGSMSFQGDREAAACRMNCLAADEIGRQIRLREIGGMVVIDFIHLKSEKDKKAVVDRLRESVRNDPATVKIFGYTKLGLVELTRKRRRHGLRDRVVERRKKQMPH
ncbi:ribonuclease [Sporolactobacillus sp. THM7-7]|nr:ribonuclease [Sporolactobacillus sp. THM7-7]